MVHGVHGHVGHVVRLVVVEQRIVLEDVIILHPTVEEMVVLAQVLKNVLVPLTVLVRPKFY